MIKKKKERREGREGGRKAGKKRMLLSVSLGGAFYLLSAITKVSLVPTLMVHSPAEKSDQERVM